MSRRAIATRIAGALLAASAVAAVPGLSVSGASTRGVAPTTPTSVAASSAKSSLVVTWAEVPTGFTTSFTATARSAGRATKSCVVQKLRCTIAGLTNGVVYVVTVTATDKFGTSSPSSPISALVGVPGPPRSVLASPTSAGATVNWAAPKLNGTAGVTLYMATASPGGFSCSVSGTVLSAPGHTCQIAGLTTGVVYTITVTATNSFGTGVPSSSTTVIAG